MASLWHRPACCRRGEELIPVRHRVWLADIMTAGGVQSAVRNATPGVVYTPTDHVRRRHWLGRPHRVLEDSPDARGSRPTTRTGGPAELAGSAINVGRRDGRSSASSSVMASCLARTRGSEESTHRSKFSCQCGASALAVRGALRPLRPPSCAPCTRVPVSIPSRLQRRYWLRVHRVQRPSHAEPQGPGLTGDPATVDAGITSYESITAAARRLGDDLRAPCSGVAAACGVDGHDAARDQHPSDASCGGRSPRSAPHADAGRPWAPGVLPRSGRRSPVVLGDGDLSISVAASDTWVSLLLGIWVIS